MSCLYFFLVLSGNHLVGKDIIQEKKIKVGLIIDEFFGGAGTWFGGYGFLARRFIARYIPNENIEIEVLLGVGGDRVHEFHEDNITLYYLPNKMSKAKKFLKKKNYDIYLSVELTYDYVLKCEPNQKKRLILWIQDPRPKCEWNDVIDTMQSIKEVNYFNQDVYDMVNKWARDKRIRFISQGNSLNPLAVELYNLPMDTSIQYLPNPVDIDFDFKFNLLSKKKQVLYLGRLAAPKRPWLFCEIAKKMPEYEFFIVGDIFGQREDNEKMLKPYMNASIPNLHFVGHNEGAEKLKFLKESRLLLSTSIHEGIAISWLEALSYGTLVVSNLERESLIERFGGKAPDLLGDGFEGTDAFIPIIRNLMENDEVYAAKAQSAIEYIRETHNIPRFIKNLRNVIINETMKDVVENRNKTKNTSGWLWLSIITLVIVGFGLLGLMNERGEKEKNK